MAGAGATWQAWAGVAAGALLLAAAPALAFLRAPQAVAYAAAIAGATLALLTYPVRSPAQPGAAGAVAAWDQLAREMGLHGPAAAPTGRLFLSTRRDAARPLDDGRALYDGADGYPAGLALPHPLAGLLADWLERDPDRLRSPTRLEDDLRALGQATGWFGDVRATQDAEGLRYRFAGRPAMPDALSVHWLVLAATARATGRPCILDRQAQTGPGPTHEGAIRWLPA